MSQPSGASSLLERLLYEEESDALDFKQAQYPFVQALEEEKAELLKDILAFANSWRRVDAYIVVGVKDVKGGRAEILGVTSHLEDAQLQQFVNSKTQRPVQFSYRALEFEGKQVALIHVPVQARPFYLKAAYAQLKAGEVLVRRGSSTATALPDEIAQMGRAEVVAQPPLLDVFFADPSKRTRSDHIVRSCVLTVPPPKSIPAYRLKNEGPFGSNSLARRANADYYRELVRYTKLRLLVSPLYLAVANSGETSAQDVRVQIVIPGAESGVTALDEHAYPDLPRAEYDLTFPISPAYARRQPELTVERIGDTWVLEAGLAKVQPQATAWILEPFYIGADSSTTIDLVATVYADNLSQPHQQTLQVPIESRVEEADLDRVIALESDRFAESDEYKRLLKQFEDGG